MFTCFRFSLDNFRILALVIPSVGTDKSFMLKQIEKRHQEFGTFGNQHLPSIHPQVFSYVPSWVLCRDKSRQDYQLLSQPIVDSRDKIKFYVNSNNVY